MPETRIKLEGFRELTRALNDLPERVGENVARAALRDAAKPLRAGMEQRVRRSRTAPHIADKILVRSTRRFKDKRFPVTIAVGPSEKFFYGWFLEKGTSSASAHPWARPAFEEWAPSALKELRATFWKRIKAAAKKLARKSR